MQSLHEVLDIHKHQYSEVTALKRKYPHLKVLLSVGGDQDIDPEHPNKYLELWEGEKVKQTSFINSAYSLVRSYGFDGLDLAFQFPKNKPRKVHFEIGMVWKKFKKLFTGDYIVDEKAEQHKEEFTAFVIDVKNDLRPDNMMLTLTVLPNVNSTCSAKFTIADMNIAMKYCSHLIYKYVDINADTFKIMSVNRNLDIKRRHFTTITELKETFPYAKFFLSVSGPSDQNTTDKYIKLLEAGRKGQSVFINSAVDFLRRFNFDGLDLSFQLPRNKPRKVHTDTGASWKNFKKFFTGPFVVDEKASEHRKAFTDLVKDLKSALTADNKLLSLTVLPNVNSSWYFDGPALAPNLDIINLATFDFLTPERNPKAADYTAPLCEFTDQTHLGHYNVIYQVEYWLIQRVPHHKLNVGIATYGRAWKMTKGSGTTGLPVVTATDGPAAAGPITQTPGMLNWLEICQRLPKSGKNTKHVGAPLRPVHDDTKCYGSYAFHTADKNGANGIWVSYEDPQTAASKAEYVKAKTLGGVALFDINLDDFHGQCTGEKFPITKAIKQKF
ncbi:chitinase-like protein Idgf3 isoform X2 [Eurosta solidaginis]